MVQQRCSLQRTISLSLAVVQLIIDIAGMPVPMAIENTWLKTPDLFCDPCIIFVYVFFLFSSFAVDSAHSSVLEGSIVQGFCGERQNKGDSYF